MNPFFLLLGLLGATTFTFGNKSSDAPLASPADDEDDNDNDNDSSDGDDSQTEVEIALVAYDGSGNLIQSIENGQSFNFGAQDVSNYKVGAEVTGSGFQSVLFEVDDQVFVQNLAPYDMPIEALNLEDDEHTIKVTAFSGFNGEGELLATETISFQTSAIVEDDTDDADDDSDTDDSSDDDTDDSSDDGADDGTNDDSNDDGGDGDTDDSSDDGADDGTNDDTDDSSDDDDDDGDDSDDDDTDTTGGDDSDDDDTDSSDDDETPALVGIALVAYGDGGAVVADIDNGESLDFGSEDVSGYMLGAEITGDALSVLFEVNGEVFVQNIAPYNMPVGEIDFSDGNHTVTVTAHSDFNGEGDLLASETFTFDTTAMVMDDDDGMDDGMDHDDPDDTDDDDGMDDGMDHDDTDDDDGDMDHDDHDDTDDDDGDMDHGDHDDDDDHSTPDIPPPGVGASQAEINAFVSALANAPEVHVHDAGSDMSGEHTAAMDLVDRGEATHVAIGDGDWDDPNIWSNGEVPGDDAKVLIPDGVTVDYAVVSDARLFTVRVDGKLDFATDTDSQMIFDTFVVSPTGHLEIGTASDPVDPDVNVDLIVASNGPIDTDWDPMLLSRGLISHGKATIHGAEKDSHDKVTDDPMEGDTSIKMDGVPDGWQVGDTIVIAGTHFEGYTWGSDVTNPTAHPSEDEVRVISQIDSNGTIWFEDPLEHDHDAPRDDLHTSVANYTRNVSIETEDGADAEIYERGHVMFMHSDDVDVRYAEFLELGRTDKSETSANVDNFDSVDYDTNVQGRYSVHLHRTGTDDTDDPAILEGNAVYGSPGWGFVHHDSHAELTNNATFDTYGAGYVAETGNETGLWDDNIAIYAEGIMWAIPKNTADTEEDAFDTGRGGDGFWFQGRMVESTNNVAASVNTGFVYFHRDGDDTMIPISADQFDYPAAMFFDERMWADHAPILSFSGNETFAAREGLHVVKSNPNQEHDVHSHLDDFTAWSVVSGAHLEYTSHYILTNFDIIGKEDGEWTAQDGISIGNNTSDLTIIDANIEGFKVGIDLNKSFNDTSNSMDLHDYIVVDATFTDVDTEYGQYDPQYDTITSKDDLPDNAPEIDIQSNLYWDYADNRTLVIEGTKTDGIGTTDYPAGLDHIHVERDDMVQILERTGYWETSDGERYTLVDFYFTDRATGDIYYETQPVIIGDAPLGSSNADGGRYENAIDNGIQDFTTVNGVKMAGDTPLDVTQSATVVAMQSVTASATVEDHSDHDTMMDMEDETHTVMIDMDQMAAMALEIGDDDLFVNTTVAADVDLTATGGSTVLAKGGAEFDLTEGRTLAVFEAAANVGFDGDDGGIAILDMHEGSTVAFAAEDGDLGTIEEFSSGAYGDEPDVQSGIDLGNATLSIDLTGLTAEAGTAFTLMDADEIVGIFEEAVIGGLGAQNAKIVVDYENDSVSLQLSAGDGAVEVETLGQETDVTSGEEALWAALTADQGIHEDHDMGMDDDEDDMLDSAA